MAWHTTEPVGTISVRANRTILQDNTTYIETTMGNSIVGTNTNTTRDHFWNVGADEDGRHRFINSLAFTVGGNQADPVLGANMSCILYARRASIDDQSTQYFYYNSTNSNKYQVTPSYVVGTHVVTGSYTLLATVPENVYGEIFMFRTLADGNLTLQLGYFKSTGGGGAQVAPIALKGIIPNGSSDVVALNFNHDGALGITVKAEDASAGNTWEYRITYRVI